ncbi:MAG TPA: histidine phosphatase family protein [Burkholderiales bacterium]|nr:histidine phosphatase family protein [Burkholderiales bacterium]
MTLLALLRHGETAWSAAGRIQGRADVPLLPGISISIPKSCGGMRIVTSPLRRCVETAALLGAADAARESRIIEMDWGEWQGESFVALRERLGEEMRANEARGLDFRPPGGESPRLVLARVKTWLKDVAQAGEPTLAVTHRGVIRALFAEATGWDMRGKPPARLEWDAVHLFEVDQAGAPRVQRLNVK